MEKFSNACSLDSSIEPYNKDEYKNLKLGLLALPKPKYPITKTFTKTRTSKAAHPTDVQTTDKQTAPNVTGRRRTNVGPVHVNQEMLAGCVRRGARMAESQVSHWQFASEPRGFPAG